jgi:hypothetical protein
MGFMGCVFGLAEMFNKYEESIEQNEMTDESLEFLINNRRLFRSTGPTMIPSQDYVSEEESVDEIAAMIAASI